MRAVHQTVAVKFNSFSNLNCKLINKYIFVVTSVCKMSDFDVSDLCKRGRVCVCKIERSATHVVALYFLMCSAVALCLSTLAVTSLIILHINTYICIWHPERSRVLVQRKKKRTLNVDYDFKVASKLVGNSKITSIIACVRLH